MFSSIVELYLFSCTIYHCNYLFHQLWVYIHQNKINNMNHKEKNIVNKIHFQQVKNNVKMENNKNI